VFSAVQTYSGRLFHALGAATLKTVKHALQISDMFNIGTEIDVCGVSYPRFN